jgi:hypothetical protein
LGFTCVIDLRGATPPAASETLSIAYTDRWLPDMRSMSAKFSSRHGCTNMHPDPLCLVVAEYILRTPRNSFRINDRGYAGDPFSSDSPIPGLRRNARTWMHNGCIGKPCGPSIFYVFAPTRPVVRQRVAVCHPMRLFCSWYPLKSGGKHRKLE